MTLPQEIGLQGITVTEAKGLCKCARRLHKPPLSSISDSLASRLHQFQAAVGSRLSQPARHNASPMSARLPGLSSNAIAKSHITELRESSIAADEF